MKDPQTDRSELPSTTARQNAFHPMQVLRSVGLSLLVNGICPFLIYTYLESHFSKGSVQPLVYASIPPVLALVFGIVRKRMVDMIAVIALLAISINIAAIFLTPSIEWALAARSIDGVFTATVLLISALIGRPLFYYVARQFVMANDPTSIEGFDSVNDADGRRTFFIVTLAWALGTYALCALNVTLALNVSPSNYLLASQVTTMTATVGLTVWTIRFAHVRLTRLAAM